MSRLTSFARHDSKTMFARHDSKTTFARHDSKTMFARHDSKTKYYRDATRQHQNVASLQEKWLKTYFVVATQQNKHKMLRRCKESDLKFIFEASDDAATWHRVAA